MSSDVSMSLTQFVEMFSGGIWLFEFSTKGIVSSSSSTTDWVQKKLLKCSAFSVGG